MVSCCCKFYYLSNDIYIYIHIYSEITAQLQFKSQVVCIPEISFEIAN